ncbi:MAG TPA: acetylxylan esterase [Abditibacteriaceae bacterium]|nr:acetylxylan esterase [Abditibacteriaceae bacterium]
MPLIDMPLAELQKYAGRNPRPVDLDEYWEAALAEMRALDSAVELVPHQLNASFAECFDLYFTGAGGARVHAKYLRPKNVAEPHPAVVVLHGYSGSSGDWCGHLAYVAQGFSVAALDCRGQGGDSEDVGGVLGNTLHGHIIRGLTNALNGQPEKLLFRQIFLDCAQLAGIVMEMPEVDAARVGATGASQGGGLTLACAALEPRLKLAAPIYPFLCDYQRVWEMDLATGAYEELRAYFRHFDPLHERHADIFNCLGYIDNQHLAHRIRAEVLMPVGLMDTICPPSTQFAAYNKIQSSKNFVLYPDFGHESLPGVGDKIFDFMAHL